MKEILKIFFVQFLLSLVFALLLNGGIDSYDFMTFFGLMNLIIGFLGIVVGGLMNFNDKRKMMSRNLLTASGILLLIGFGTCSQFPLRFIA